MTERPDNAERLSQRLDDLVAEIIDRFANEGHGTVTRGEGVTLCCPPRDPGPAETAKSLTRSQRDALRAIAFFRRQRKAGKGWLVGHKRLSGKVVERVGMMELVEESFIGGQPILQLTIVGRAIEAKLQ